MDIGLASWTLGRFFPFSVTLQSLTKSSQKVLIECVKNQLISSKLKWRNFEIIDFNFCLFPRFITRIHSLWELHFVFPWQFKILNENRTSSVYNFRLRRKNNYYIKVLFPFNLIWYYKIKNKNSSKRLIFFVRFVLRSRGSWF